MVVGVSVRILGYSQNNTALRPFAQKDRRTVFSILIPFLFQKSYMITCSFSLARLPTYLRLVLRPVLLFSVRLLEADI